MTTLSDTLIRRAGERRDRRFAMQALGATALLGAVSAPGVTAAKKKRGRSNDKKKALKLCKRQVGQCQAAIDESCAGDAACEALLTPCCDALARCDLTSFLDCIEAGTPTEN